MYQRLRVIQMTEMPKESISIMAQAQGQVDLDN